MGYLHGIEDGERPATLCSHGYAGGCPTCDPPAETRGLSAHALARLAEQAAYEAEQARRAKEEAEYEASLSPYALACYQGRLEDAYALLPAVCYLHEQDSDGYPPPPKRVAKPTFAKYVEVMRYSYGCRSYSDQP